MGEKGWWRQIQSDDYPETKTDYGQSIEALQGHRPTKTPDSYERMSLQKKCKKCGRTYWIDKGCTFCEPAGNDKKHRPHRKTLPKISQTKINRKVRVLCPICGSRMVLRTTKKGKYAGQKFWGCSKFPHCRAISQYRHS
ncbi:topoisomerase DNA-binding C4 zinc finger domain-containing protein [Thermodesulfobacteriota bacterium]